MQVLQQNPAAQHILVLIMRKGLQLSGYRSLSRITYYFKWGGPTSPPNIYTPAGLFSIRSCFLLVQVWGFPSTSVDSGAVLQLVFYMNFRLSDTQSHQFSTLFNGKEQEPSDLGQKRKILIYYFRILKLKLLTCSSSTTIDIVPFHLFSWI